VIGDSLVGRGIVGNQPSSVVSGGTSTIALTAGRCKEVTRTRFSLSRDLPKGWPEVRINENSGLLKRGWIVVL
jgi:hypothetical protein